MTTKPKAQKYRTRRTSTSTAEAGPAMTPPTAGQSATQTGAPQAPAAPSVAAAPQTSAIQTGAPQTSATPPQTAGAGVAAPAPSPASVLPGATALSGGAPTAAPTAPKAMSGAADSPQVVAAHTDIDAIRQEGLTGRQLRMARRVAQKNGLAVTSDFDAVRQLRQRGIDPFQRANVLELVTPDDAQTDLAANQMQIATSKVPAEQAKVQLPQTVKPGQNLPSTQVGGPVGAPENPAERRASEIRRIQKDIARRRRRNLISLFGRLSMFVFLPTVLAGYYFYVIATPMYGTKSEFVIQQAESTGGGGGLGSLFSGTGLATQTDSTTVQSYMTSREAFLRLDEDHGFTEHFSDPAIDGIQRLAPDASREEAYSLFQSHVQIGYDPTEGILKMEVVAVTPEKSQEFSEALIGYAEEQVDQLTQRVRTEQMMGADENLIRAEERRAAALANLVSIQEEVQQPDPVGESAALQQRITNLQIRLDEERLSLASLQENRRPNEASVSASQAEIGRLEDQIELLRSELSSGDGGSLVSNNARLREAEENYAFEVANVQTAQASRDAATMEANRQVRYLSVSVAPISPDEATYPRGFENTLLAFLIFSGVYLMISLTASILREQVSS